MIEWPAICQTDFIRKNVALYPNNNNFSLFFWLLMEKNTYWYSQSSTSLPIFLLYGWARWRFIVAGEYPAVYFCLPTFDWWKDLFSNLNLFLWRWHLQDLTIKPKYLVTFTVGYAQKNNINAAVKKVASF